MGYRRVPVIAGLQIFLVFLVALLIVGPAYASEPANACAVFYRTDKNLPDEVKQIQRALDSNIVKRCVVEHDEPSYFVLTLQEKRIDNLCHYIERRVFRPNAQSPDWTTYLSHDEHRLTESVDLMLIGNTPCPDPYDLNYTRTIGLSEDEFVHFMGSWNSVVRSKRKFYEALQSVRLPTSNESYFSDFKAAVTSGKIRAETLKPTQDPIKRYELTVVGHRGMWSVIVTLIGAKLEIYDVLRVID